MIKFNEVTWYSKLAAVILFLVVIPALTFYIGTQYEQAREVEASVPRLISFAPSTDKVAAASFSAAMSSIRNSVSASSSVKASAYTAKQDLLPTKIGQCALTKVARVAYRLQEGENGPYINDSGSAIEYTNKGYQVSYSAEPGVDNSKAGDVVNLCLVGIPEDCPAGDDRGKMYRATNLRTYDTWLLQDSEHSCGGA
jgi:hypothetical protein